MKDHSYDDMRVDNPFLQRADDLQRIDGLVARHRQEGLAAVRIAHEDELNEIAGSVNQGQSVLVLCDKALAEYLFGALSGHPRLRVEWDWVTYSGTPIAAVMPHLGRSLSERLRGANEAPKHVVVARHLDLMTYTVDDRPRPEVNDILYWLAEYPATVKLFFWDPIFTLPAVLEAAFPNKVRIRALKRELLWRLMTPDEGRKFSPDESGLTVAAQSALYQYVSGTSVVEFRRIIRSVVDPELGLHDLPGAAPERPGELPQPTKALGYVRQLTGLAPPVPSAVVSGYEDLQLRLEREVVFPMKLRLRATDEHELRRADSLMQRGVVLHGDPGTGKTEWAKWLAHRLDTPLFVIHGPELKNRFVGETEAAIRRVIQQARRNAPAAILIDEMDALMASRSEGSSAFENSVVNTLLTEMDGMRTEETVIFIGTTNRLEALDRAFLRPGRFGLSILVDYPDEKDRKAILCQYNAHFMLDLKEPSIANLVRLTESRGEERFTGDHLRAICQYLSRESLYRLEYESDRTRDPKEEGFQKDAVDEVRRRQPRRAPVAPRW